MRSLLLLIAGVSLWAGPASAQQASPARGALFISPMGQPFRASDGETGVQRWFAQADRDHDGKISLQEFIADADAAFTHADRNGDAAVLSGEVTALWEREAPEVIDTSAGYEAPLDPNAPVEGSAHVDRNSSRNDITGSHIASVRGGRRGPAPIGAQAYGLLGDPEPIMSCDSNFDRRIDKAEFEQCASRRFVELDANRDGFFTPDEVHPWLTGQARAQH